MSETLKIHASINAEPGPETSVVAHVADRLAAHYRLKAAEDIAKSAAGPTKVWLTRIKNYAQEAQDAIQRLEDEFTTSPDKVTAEGVEALAQEYMRGQPQRRMVSELDLPPQPVPDQPLFTRKIIEDAAREGVARDVYRVRALQLIHAWQAACDSVGCPSWKPQSLSWIERALSLAAGKKEKDWTVTRMYLQSADFQAALGYLDYQLSVVQRTDKPKGQVRYTLTYHGEAKKS